MVIKTGFLNKAILFVDDNRTIQKIVKNIVDESEFRLDVISALTGEDAIEILYNKDGAPKPSIILLDLNLPAMNGQEVLKAIQQDKDLQNIPVVVLTASDDQEEINDLKKQGARECYTKPFDFYLFNTLVEKIVKKWCQNPNQTLC
tara:strand:- start:2295 stop:2732 length:438 start_codon:yes stop_codon:yes gene_type:complete